jgi:hypothetical protein
VRQVRAGRKVFAAARSAGPDQQWLRPPFVTHLRKSKIDQNANLRFIIVQKVCRFDITMDDPASVNIRKTAEQAEHIRCHMLSVHMSVKVLYIASACSVTFTDRPTRKSSFRWYGITTMTWSTRRKAVMSCDTFLHPLRPSRISISFSIRIGLLVM